MYQTYHWNMAVKSSYIQTGPKIISFGQKRPQKKKKKSKTNILLYFFMFQIKKRVYIELAASIPTIVLHLSDFVELLSIR